MSIRVIRMVMFLGLGWRYRRVDQRLQPGRRLTCTRRPLGSVAVAKAQPSRFRLMRESRAGMWLFWWRMLVMARSFGGVA